MSPSVSPIVEFIVVGLVLTTAVTYLVRRAVRRNPTSCAAGSCGGCALACTRSSAQTLRARPNDR